MHHKILKLLALSLLIASCREPVDWDFPQYDPIPTISGLIVAGEPITVHVSLAGSIDSALLVSVNDAVVKIFEDGEYLATLKHETDGLYTSAEVAEAGLEYQCEVIIPSSGMIWATTTIPKPIPILSTELIANAGFDYWGDPHPALEITFSNNPEDDVYIEIKLWRIKDDMVERVYSHDNNDLSLIHI